MWVDYIGENTSGNPDCEKCVAHIKRKQQIYCETIRKIKENGCQLDFMCANFNGASGFTTRLDSTWWPFSSIKILIVLDCCTGANQTMNSPEDTIGHELEHAKDHCYGTRESGCAGSICTEIKAYTVGGCKGLRGSRLKECLKQRVPNSSALHCRGKDMNEIFEENYDRCIRDMPH